MFVFLMDNILSSALLEVQAVKLVNVEDYVSNNDGEDSVRKKREPSFQSKY